MAPHEDPLTSPENQLPGVWGPKPRVRRPRRRKCLLKGCRRKFRPQQPLARYCSEACRERARQWRAWKARRRYRQSTNGKQKRQAQSRRYRERWLGHARTKKLSRRATRGSSLPNFFYAPATVRGAMRSSIALGDHRCSGFVLRPADTLWSEFWNGNGAGISEHLGRQTEAPGKKARSARR
jgi:hypothetical protein